MSVGVAAAFPDRQPGAGAPGDGRALPDLTGLEALAGVLASYGVERLAGRGDTRASDRDLRAAVRRLADEARERGARGAEALIIELRSEWGKLPAVRRLARDGPRGELWDRIVALCCEEFYPPKPGA